MGKIALININYIDIESGAEYLNKTIEIEDDKISSICDAADYKMQNEAHCVDFSNCWAMPGIVDMHTHITFPYQFSEPEYHKTPQKIIDTAKNNLLELRNAGITVCRDMGSYANSAEWAKCFFKDDKSLPLLLTCGDVFTYEQGHMCNFGIEVLEKQSITGFVKGNLTKGADFFKIASDPKDTEASARTPNPAFDKETISIIVEYAKKNDMLVACHTYPSQEGVMRALRAGVRTIEHAAPFDRTMGKDFFPNAYFVPTFVAAVDDCGVDKLLNINDTNKDMLQVIERIAQHEEKFSGEIPKSIEEWFSILLKVLPYSIETNQLLCIGSDAGCKGTNFSSAIREILLLSAMGFSNNQVLQFATTNAYKALDFSDRGKIKEGFVADLLILKKNPTLDITTLLCNVAVICRGNIVKNNLFMEV